MSQTIHYVISPADPKGHLFQVTLTIPAPQKPIQALSLPNWILGSYLIRDFSKHINSLTVYNDQQQPLALSTVDKSTWSFESTGETVTVSYEVYAWDLSVRGAHFDESHGFFNGTSVFLCVDGQRNLPCSVEIQANEFSKENSWKVATGMPVKKVDSFGFGLYQVDDYDSLIDYPVELGTFKEIKFEACGIPHRVALTGLFELDEARLKADLIKICETEIKLFGEPAPMDDYLFQVMVTGSDYGGLEHRNSTALMCSRDDLPYIGMTEPSDGYLQFLELCSHEYFHTWNVKRIQPEVYQLSNLQEPVYTNQLWWFEGITSYYDGLILLRAGIIDQTRYLKILAEQMTRVYRMPGRFKQSVAESSLLTWTKFYQQDENAPNSIISYYTKGSLIALGLDLTIRQQTSNKKSLDDVLLHLWRHYGSKGVGLKEFEIEQICSQVSGIDLTEFFDAYLYGTQDLPFETLFEVMNVKFEQRRPTSLADKGGKSSEPLLLTHLGVNLVDTEHQTVKITHVWQNQPAYHAGLAAGDEIIAINQLKTPSVSSIEARLKRLTDEGTLPVWQCSYFRRDELRHAQIQLTVAPQDRVVLTIRADKSNDCLDTKESD